MVVSPLAAAGAVTPTLLFPGATWAPYASKSMGGCANAQMIAPHWTALNGAGRMRVQAAANTCPAYRGGPMQSSYAYASNEISVNAPVVMFTGVGGVNVTWNMNFAAVAGGVLFNSTCPTPTLNIYGYGFQYCQIYWSASVGMYAYLVDNTNGSYFYPSNYWGGYYNYNDSYNYTYCYSFTCYGPYSGSYGYTFGSTGVQSPTLFFNGTFNGADSYSVLTYVYTSADASCEGFQGPCHAVAKVNMQSGGNYVNLGALAPW
jgi:hypothetical protein